MLNRHSTFQGQESRPQLTYRFLNPLLVKRRRKSDIIDLEAIAHCLGDSSGYPAALYRRMGKIGTTLHAAHKASRLCRRRLFGQLPFSHNVPVEKGGRIVK